MQGFLYGIAVGAFGLFMLIEPETKVVEVLPENYARITDISESICMGPFNGHYVGQTVETQRVQYQ